MLELWKLEYSKLEFWELGLPGDCSPGEASAWALGWWVLRLGAG